MDNHSWKVKYDASTTSITVTQQQQITLSMSTDIQQDMLEEICTEGHQVTNSNNMVGIQVEGNSKSHLDTSNSVPPTQISAGEAAGHKLITTPAYFGHAQN